MQKITFDFHNWGHWYEDASYLFVKKEEVEKTHISLGFRTDSEWLEQKRKERQKVLDERIKKLKDDAFGSAVKTLDEISQATHNFGVTSSLEEAKELVSKLAGNYVTYKGTIFRKFITFDKVTNQSGESRYRLTTHSAIPPFYTMYSPD